MRALKATVHWDGPGWNPQATANENLQMSAKKNGKKEIQEQMKEDFCGRNHVNIKPPDTLCLLWCNIHGYVWA